MLPRWLTNIITVPFQLAHLQRLQSSNPTMLPGWLTGIFTIPFQLAHLLRRPRAEDPQGFEKRPNAAVPWTLSPSRKEIDLSYNPAINTSSTLLNKLPLELRQQIYTYALGIHLVHIFQTRFRIAHVCCSHHTNTNFTHDRCPSTRERFYTRPIHSPPSHISVALLLTCRQIYTEALTILYVSNTFDFDDLSTFNFLVTSIPPTGLSAIRSLHILWNSHLAEEPTAPGAPSIDATYLRFWRTLASVLPALKELRMAITDRWWLRILELEDAWVQPMKEVNGLEVFEFEIVAHTYCFWKKEQVDEFAGRLRSVLCREKE